jgi:hypothetical protein
MIKTPSLFKVLSAAIIVGAFVSLGAFWATGTWHPVAYLFLFAFFGVAMWGAIHFLSKKSK